jgi:hypothetical protein
MWTWRGLSLPTPLDSSPRTRDRRHSPEEESFRSGANDGEASSSRCPPPALRAGGHCGDIYIGEAAHVGAALAQPAPLLPKPEEEDDPEMRTAMALSKA